MTPASVFERYRGHFDSTWPDDAPIEQVRFVSLDLETTGLDPANDAIVTIGAVAVQAGEIVLDDSFSALLKVSENTTAVTVHGVTRDQTQDGLDEQTALEELLEYLKDGVIVGHHIGHDIITINRAMERLFGARLQNESLDTMDLSLHLKNDGAFAYGPEFEDFSLDALCDLFGIEAHDRHTAGGDAFITAQIFIRLLRLAGKAGRTTLGALAQPYDAALQA